MPSSETESPLTSSRKSWLIFTELMTWYIPECILMRIIGSSICIQQAWREKVTIFTFFILVSFILLYVIVLLPPFVCPEIKIFTWEDVYSSNTMHMIVQGKVLDVNFYQHIHPYPRILFSRYSSTDISYMFREPSLANYSNMVYPEVVARFKSYQLNDTSSYCTTNFCHESGTVSLLQPIMDITWSFQELHNIPNANWIVLYHKVYNVSRYVIDGRGIYLSEFDHTIVAREMAYYLKEALNSTIMSRLGDDATSLFEQLIPSPFERKSALALMDAFYYSGLIDTRKPRPVCTIVNNIYLSLIIVMASVVVIKFLASLWILVLSYPTCDTKNVLILIPCYTEGEDSLKKTIYSVMDSDWKNKKKLTLFIVVDGLAIGKGNHKSTAEIMLKILGAGAISDEFPYDYESRGEHHNNASIYSGTHASENSSIDYIIVIKKENRGKRDSQTILLNYLFKLYEITEGEEDVMEPLELGLNQHFKKLNLNPLEYEFMLSLDADTFAQPKSIVHLVYRMNDEDIIGLCGETLVANSREGLIAAIQVYDYYINHNLNKAFENLFSSVTCLPGCFSLFRIRSPCKRYRYIIHRNVIAAYNDRAVDTLHKKNLLHLGEDRYFTSLLIREFPTKKLKFVPEAKCETVVPTTFKVLLSQRRRWINSTLHNLWELLFFKRMCGLSIFSMKSMILLDIISTLLLPAGCCYLFYLIFLFSTGTPLPLPFIIVTGTIGGVQIAVFVIKRDFIYIIWFALYLMALPLWLIIFPTYAIWKMDDISWGSTHKISPLTEEEESLANIV